MTPPDSTRSSREGFLGQLYAGRFRWDLLAWPAPDPVERAAGDAIVAELGAFLREAVDPLEVERTGELPAGLLSAYRERGYLKLSLPAALGGRGLSCYNTFRALVAAQSWCMPAGYVLAIHTGFGCGALLPALPEGTLRAHVTKRLMEGAISGWADTEPTGAANRLASTVAEPIEGGRAYLLRGSKVFIGNGSIADLLNVSATVREGEREEVRVFVVDTDSPGFSVRQVHQLMGFRGLPIAALELDGVRVGRERMISGDEHHWRASPLLEPLSSLGRMYTIAGASLAIAKRCLRWSVDFAGRRRINGRPLNEYDEIRHMISATAADVLAIESIVQLGLDGVETADGLTRRWFEQIAAKNLCSRACWRVVDRTMSLLAAEGYETAGSKASRGAPPEPLEATMREARGLRIAGGVDFQFDNRAALTGLMSFHTEPSPPLPEPEPVTDPRLGEAGARHLTETARQTTALARACRALAPREALAEQEHTLILLSQIGGELFLRASVLARAAAQPDTAPLADVACAASGVRLAALWAELEAEPAPVALSAGQLGELLADLG
jgi:alkylation response protein AidB-like acyl-CoA dehydrogenase